MPASRGAKTLLAVASLSAGVVWYIHYSQERDKAVGGRRGGAAMPRLRGSPRRRASPPCRPTRRP